MKWPLLLLIAITSGVQGQTVYKSVDADGSITYSDQPAANGELVETLEFEENTDTKDAAAESAARIEEMAKVTDRLKLDRQQRDETRRAEEELALARQQLAPPMIYKEEHYSSRYPWYNRRHFLRSHRHHHHNKPTPHRFRTQNLNNPNVIVPKSKLLTPRGFEQKRGSARKSQRYTE